MDALKFLSEMKRMCYSAGTCRDCPLHNLPCNVRPDRPDEEDKEIVSKVEKWSNDHPITTRADRFLTQYPDAPINEEDGLPEITPCHISKEYKTKLKQKCGLWDDCAKCRKEFWNGEAE